MIQTTNDMQQSRQADLDADKPYSIRFIRGRCSDAICHKGRPVLWFEPSDFEEAEEALRKLNAGEEP